jgi:hypothetical protein
MNEIAPLIDEQRAKQRASLLMETEGNIGRYLYGSNRCAIAHAGGTPTADPEDPADMRRLREDLPLVRALAEHAIEHAFGIKSATTVYREHLYELEGFKTFFGPTRVEAIRENGGISENDWPELPRLSIGLALHEEYSPLENLAARIIDVRDGRAIVRCSSTDGLSGIILGLNFRQERLEIDIQKGILALDDGSEYAARQGASAVQFCLDYLMNGILEVRAASSNQLLARCDAFLPTNLDMGATYRNYTETIQCLEAKAAERATDGG